MEEAFARASTPAPSPLAQPSATSDVSCLAEGIAGSVVLLQRMDRLQLRLLHAAVCRGETPGLLLESLCR